MLVYRDGERTVRGSTARSELLSAIERAVCPETALRALLLAAEIETALEDARAPHVAASRRVTDVLAEAWLAEAAPNAPDLSSHVAGIELPETMRLRTPEGYAYYALDPRSYVRVAVNVECQSAMVVGIRSIGTSLSAILRAALRIRGKRVQRFTLRPSGHPWNRRAVLDRESEQLVQESKGARFIVVDEGPGLSGSSFLAVGECLERAGVPIDEIELIPSHVVDPAVLRAPGAMQRWARFRRVRPAPRAAAPCEGVAVGAGEWRRTVYRSESSYPAVWKMLERPKYISADRRYMIKFAGFSPYGDAARERGQILADAGYCPPLRSTARGYVAQQWFPGTPLSTGAPRARILPCLLDYLAFRHRAFPAEHAGTDVLASMLEVNVAESLGASCLQRLEVERPVYADGRLLPHEWIDVGIASPLKVDATDHGDDHLLPGPCDSAWDIAGAAVEWRLSARETEDFVEGYRARTGDDVKRRLHPYLLAYAAFRVGWCDMALNSADSGERTRLERAVRRYRNVLSCLLLGGSARQSSGA